MVKNELIIKLFIWLRGHKNFSILIITTTVSLIFFLQGINSWKFSFVGDEWAFFTFAQSLIDKGLFQNPFDINGTYGFHYVIGSVYQSIVMMFFGNNSFGWRFSNILLVIPITIFFYQFVRNEFDKQTALYSTILLQSSFFLANFFKIGYINPQALALFILSLWAASTLNRNKKALNAIVLGAILGISFYFYIGPLFIVIFSPYIISSLIKSPKRKALILLLGVIITYLILLSLFIEHFSSLNEALIKTVAHKEFANNQQLIINVLRNFQLFYKYYDYSYGHFVSGPYLDIITRVLALIGTTVAMFSFKKRGVFLLLLTYILTCIAIGATSPYSYAPTSRGMFFLPFGFIFAGIALSKISKKSNTIYIYSILFCIFILNVYISQIETFKIAGHTTTSLILREIQIDEKKSYNNRLVFLTSDSNYNLYNLKTLMRAYEINKVELIALNILEAENLIYNNVKVVVVDRDSDAYIFAIKRCTKRIGCSLVIIKPTIYN